MNNRYVADAHALIWYINSDKKLGANAKAAFEETRRGEALLLIPAVALAEVIWQIVRGKIAIKLDALWSFIDDQQNWRIVDLDAEHLLELPKVSVPEMHDRLIVIAARLTNATLITRDPEIIASGAVATIW